MRRVLIVTSSYAPTMTADMQRARQLAWELPKLGWDVEILSPSTEYQHATCIDKDSAEFFSPHSTAHCVPETWPDVERGGRGADEIAIRSRHIAGFIEDVGDLK